MSQQFGRLHPSASKPHHGVDERNTNATPLPLPAEMMEAARLAAARTILSRQLTPVLKAALMAYRFYGMEEVKDGISGA